MGPSCVAILLIKCKTILQSLYMHYFEWVDQAGGWWEGLIKKYIKHKTNMELKITGFGGVTAGPGPGPAPQRGPGPVPGVPGLLCCRLMKRGKRPRGGLRA